MYIINQESGERKAVEVLPVSGSDLKRVNKTRYFFNWKPLMESCRLFKLVIKGADDILGLMALIDHPAEERTEIKLLTSSKENVGKGKQYDRIAGCLLAFAAREALGLYEKNPCISLLPKTNLKQKYIDKYQMIDGGRQLYLEDNPLMDLIERYLL
ncbi:hypothetical protein [Mucilaginibacter dorajii]|uniref:N-acetyltransferase n=1 Tax=Mucilaginibacter dorajii TaxID=692994 RepID=A0ABP7PN47_9SPHI|nr:hypothetical protein [Mucilaginibacter dorajii]MCS3733712.1 hypothetical protein [Mucilaginibacter dorajii]